MANACDNVYCDEPSLTLSTENNVYQNEGGAITNEDDLYFTEVEGDFSNAKLCLGSSTDSREKVYYSKSPVVNKHAKSEDGVYDELYSITTGIQSQGGNQPEIVSPKTTLCRQSKTTLIIVLATLVFVLVVVLIGVTSVGSTKASNTSSISPDSIYSSTTTQEYSTMSSLPAAETQKCKTDGGNVDNMPCVFPFIYKEILYLNCTRKDHGKHWCYTKVNESGLGVETQWGNCGLGCGIKNQNKHNSECRDALPKPFSNYDECKKLNLTCKNPRWICNAKLGKWKETVGNSNSAKKCIKKLSRKDRNEKVKTFCKLTCNQCKS